jgi:transcription elongation factor Elf1
MHAAIVERNVRCPFCGESSSVLLDPSGGDQSYIEDCQVCCQPMQISFEVIDGEFTNLRVACAS